MVSCAISQGYRIHLFVWVFTSLSTLYRSYHDGKLEGQRNIQLVKVLYCKLQTNGKQLPAFPLEVGPATEPQPQRCKSAVTQRFYQCKSFSYIFIQRVLLFIKVTFTIMHHISYTSFREFTMNYISKNKSCKTFLFSL